MRGNVSRKQAVCFLRRGVELRPVSGHGGPIATHRSWEVAAFGWENGHA